MQYLMMIFLLDQIFRKRISEDVLPLLLCFTVKTVYGITYNERESASTELRAVLINCNPEIQYRDIDKTFAYDELYKYSALQECTKKIGISVQLHRDCKTDIADEFIPVEQVLNIQKQSYVRLLNPYVLRVQHETPLQIYKLRKLENLKVMITQAEVESLIKRNSSITSIEASVNKEREIRIRNDHVHTFTQHNFQLYEMGIPDIWQQLHLQLFEKIILDGKSVWNDISKGRRISVSSSLPEWIGENVAVKYRSIDWVARPEFTLSPDKMCVLVPVPEESMSNQNILIGSCLIIPMDDIFYSTDDVQDRKRDIDLRLFPENILNLTLSPVKQQVQHRNVTIRLGKAIMPDDKYQLNIIRRGYSEYLTLPFRKPYNTQIDVEANANRNQVVRIGSGRISAAVVDSTGIAPRSIFFLQITNTGIATSNFKVLLRECYPVISNTKTPKEIESGLIPPKYTIKWKVEFSTNPQIADTSACAVELINHDETPIAIRRIVVKRGDRCFCVWFCECVCLSDDTHLRCKKMPWSQQVAAGFSEKDLSRTLRFFCYDDIWTVNFITVFLGILTLLLSLGLIKGLLGIFFPCIRIWGFDRLLKTPRHLDRYFESSLRSRFVQYDNDGWPIHPDTKQRSVHIQSRFVEFILNLIFFVVMPCISVCDVLKQIIQNNSTRVKSRIRNNNEKMYDGHKCNSRQVNPSMYKLDNCSNNFQAKQFRNTEQDDTLFILLQMQKSQSSLQRYQEKTIQETPGQPE